MVEESPVVEETPVVEEAPVVEEKSEDFELSGEMEPGKTRKKSVSSTPKNSPHPEEDLGIVQPEFGF